MSVCVLVHGVHRSGASCVAGILHHLGVSMGPSLLSASPSNPLGHFEDTEFLELHRKILGELSPSGDVLPARWRYPRPDFGPHRGDYRELVQSRSVQTLWGLKDPRLSHLLPFFLEAYTGALKVVHVHRDPLQAARSLHAREVVAQPTFCVEEAESICRAHHAAALNSLLLAAERGPSLLVHHARLTTDPAAVVAELAAFVGVDSTPEAEAFIRPELVHWQPE